MPRSLGDAIRVSHLFRRQAVVYDQTTVTTGMSMFGKISVGIRQDAEDAEDQNQKRKDDEGIRPPQRKPDNPHKACTRS
jgi:hypothetical protein